MGSFSEAVQKSLTREKRDRASAGSDYVRLNSEHATVIRILDKEPVQSWSHYVPKKHTAFPNANNGKGMSFICPGMNVCPICSWNKEQKNKEEKPKNLLNSRKIYTFNVLDRTVVVACASCGAEYYENKDGYPEDCSNPDCNASLVDTDPSPRNKVQIFQKGIRVTEQFIAFEAEFGDVVNYDIKLDTRGTGDQSATICIPKPPTPLDLAEVLGEDWKDKLFNINVDIIIIATHGHSGMEHILFGSTAEKVVRKAPCPVLTLREPIKGFTFKDEMKKQQ